jgi:hypothetical protein
MAACAVSFAAVNPVLNVCPQPNTATAGATYTSQVATQGICNSTIVIAANGSASLAMGNTAPYDGAEDQLVGVVNNCPFTISSINLTGPSGTFAFDNDGICAFQPFSANSQPCNSDPTSTNYAGSATGFSNITATSGTVLFGTPIAANGGTGYFSLEGPPTTLTIVLPPVISKSFSPTTITVGGSTILSFTIMNPSSTSSATSIAFTDTLPAGLVVSTPNGLTGSCGGGTITATAGSGTVSLSGATLAASASCTFSVSVTATSAGLKTNNVTVNSAQGSNTGTAAVNVLSMPPSISKSFSPTVIAPGGTSTLSFTVANPNAASLGDIGFTDTLPSGVVVSTPNGLTGSCGGGTITATAGSGTVGLAGATLPSSSCTFSVSVTATTTGTKTNSVTVTSNVGNGNTATATLNVAIPPTISKSFGEVSIPLDSTTTLTFTLANPDPVVNLTGVAFTDTLPAGLVISTPNGLTTTCTGTIMAIPGTTTVMLADGTLAAGTSCTITLNVNGVAVGNQVNTTSALTSNQAPPGAPATAAIFVGDAFQISYATNLPFGDSFIDITNSGASITSPNHGAALTGSGTICVNVYVFDYTEEFVACCACPVTPNGLQSYSVKNDLNNSILFFYSPKSVVVKLVATRYSAGCGFGSLTSLSPAALVPGMAAWGTTLHANGGLEHGSAYSLTEKPFAQSSLSAGELERLSYWCGVTAGGSGGGLCANCRAGGLGAAAH